MPSQLSRMIPNEECVLRAAKERYHFDGPKLKWKVFQPPKGSSRISVVRHAIGDDACKQQAREIAEDDYRGLASLICEYVRDAGFCVTDERDEHYLGHAEIDLGIREPIDDEPGDPLARQQLRDRCKVLLALSRYLEDPDPNSEVWTGGPMCLPK